MEVDADMETEMETGDTSAAASSVSVSASFSKRLGMKNTIHTTFGEDYVFQIASSQEISTLAVSLSTNTIKLYSRETGQYFGECKGHRGTIHEISFSAPASPHVICSCSSDGSVRAWDTRTLKQVSQLRAGSYQEIYSFCFGGSSGNLLAGGCNAQKHPKAELYLNKPIEFYEELRIICGDDQATGSYAKSIYEDFDEPDADMAESTPSPAPNQATSAKQGGAGSSKPTSSTNKEARGKHKKRVYEDNAILELVAKVGDVAEAIKNNTTTHHTARASHWIEDLHRAVMEVEGFDEEALEIIFDYLAKDEIQARTFMVKSLTMRHRCVERYLGGNY